MECEPLWSGSGVATTDPWIFCNIVVTAVGHRWKNVRTLSLWKIQELKIYCWLFSLIWLKCGVIHLHKLCEQENSWRSAALFRFSSNYSLVARLFAATVQPAQQSRSFECSLIHSQKDTLIVNWVKWKPGVGKPRKPVTIDPNFEGIKLNESDKLNSPETNAYRCD